MARSLRSIPVVFFAIAIIAACGGNSVEELQPAGAPQAMAAEVLVVDGRLHGKNDDLVTLERAGTYVGYTFEEIATTPVTNGRFRFEIPLPAPEMMYLTAPGIEGRTELYVSAGAVTLDFADDTETPIRVDGSSIDSEYRAFKAAHDEADAAVDRAEELLDETRAETGDQDLADLERDVSVARAALKASDLDWLKRYGESTLGAYIGIRHLALQMDVDELEPLLSFLDPGLDGTQYYDQLAARLQILRAVAAGRAVPNFSGPDRNGHVIDISSFDGQAVLVDFWASWCSPCRAQNSELIALYEQYHDRGLEILGIGLEFQRERWLAAIDDDGLPWPNISDISGFDNQAAQLFAVRSLPSNVLVDRNGMIVAKNVHGEELQKLIESVL